MTRRVSTYPSGLGWTAYNLAETIGGFITLAGILLLLGNLFVSYRRGAPAGPDPWHGPTLEWTTSSPPPEYDYAVIPRVTSAYPNWDPFEPALTLHAGHQQPEVTPVDGRLAAVVQMPHESPWPPILALCLSLVFTMLLIGRYGFAAAMGLLCLLSLVGWHSQEPEEA
jgi:cytochrome c oxidase subunit 1/cytochrome c oxidase subunit I+III